MNHSALIVETTKYDVWDNFRATVVAVIDAFIASVEGLPGEQRLGLRYVDRFVRPEVSRIAGWDSWLEPWLLGPVSHPQLGDTVSALAQQIDCDAGDGLRMTIRERLFVDPERRSTHTTILDFDAFRDGYRPFDRDDVIQCTDVLNDISHRVFRAAITDRMYDALRGEPNAA